MTTAKGAARDLAVLEKHISEMERRIGRLRDWIERDRARGLPTLISVSLLKSFEDTLSLDKRRRLDVIAALGQGAPKLRDG